MNHEKLKIVDVSPRDGLQNEKKSVPLDVKFRFIKELVEAGLKHIEVGSFVGGNKIPQMKETGKLIEMLKKESWYHDFTPMVLIPNKRGLDEALSHNIKHLALFTATSNEFNKKNINATIEESFKRIKDVCDATKNEKSIFLRGYISTVFGCPYEGEKGYKELKPVFEEYLKLGVHEISLGDTTGVANPRQVQAILRELKRDFSSFYPHVAVHFHDTKGMAVVNSWVSYEEGIRLFDSSAGGIGGCPYAKSATGNLATEDLVYLLHSMGVATDISMEKLLASSSYMLDFLGKKPTSKYVISRMKET